MGSMHWCFLMTLGHAAMAFETPWSLYLGISIISYWKWFL